jgi:hypothetical protein
MTGLGFLIYNTCVGPFKPNGFGFKKTDRHRPWHGLSIPIQQHVKDLFAASLISHVGNSSNTLFWTNKWLNGCSIRDLASEVVSKVAKRALTSMIVDQALENRQWIAHIKPPLSLIGINNFFSYGIL